jgi:hypothetical protein
MFQICLTLSNENPLFVINLIISANISKIGLKSEARLSNSIFHLELFSSLDNSILKVSIKNNEK